MQTSRNVKQLDPAKVVTGECRFSYEHLLKPRVNRLYPNASPKFGVTLLLPKHDAATKRRIDEALEAAVQDGITRLWSGVRPTEIALPLHDGDGLRSFGQPFGAECRGCWVLMASSKAQPGVVDGELQPIRLASDVYSGMYGRASVRFYAFGTAEKKGVGCCLMNVQKLRDGEKLAGGSTPEEDFGGA